MSKKVVRKKRAGKKASKKVARKKVVAKRAAKKRVAAKTSKRKKAVAKKSARRKVARKKVVRKKTTSKKTARKKTASKKTARKKATRKKSARPKKASYVVAPFRSVTPHIVVRDVPAAIDFYRRAFGAVERLRVPTADGQHVMHAEILIGDSVVMMAEEMPGNQCRSPLSLGGSPVSIYLYVPNTDAVYSQAVAAGATGTMPPQDMFWGDRYGQVNDPFGHVWSIATHMRDPSPAEIAAGMAAMGQKV